ncbi:MAG: cell division protein FtsQ/DivIB [Candidatus Ornithomonoglobus sp.]
MDNKRRSGPVTERTGRDDYNTKREYSRDVNRRADRVDSTVTVRRQTPQNSYDTYRRSYTEPYTSRSRGIVYDDGVKTSSSRSYGTRRVNSGYNRTNKGIKTETTKSYSGVSYESRRNSFENRTVRSTSKITDADRRRRLEAAKKKRRMRAKRIKAAFIMLGCAVIAIVLFFMTPIFDITQIRLEGNNTVSKSVIQDKIGYLVGKNLFATRSSVIKQQMLEISQISSVEVDKQIFPAVITVSIQESNPAAYLLSGNTIVVLDSDMKVIDDSNTYNTDEIPSLSGITVPSYKVNEVLQTDSEEKDEILKTLLKSFESMGLISKISYISLDDLTNIKFNYDNRIETNCGSQTELERKIRMFAGAMASDSLSENAIGSIDLSTPGQAVYNSLK